MGKINEHKFNGIKKALKVAAPYKDISRYFDVSLESIRLIKNCPDWGQWEQNKVNRNVQLQNKKFLEQKTLIQKLKDLFGAKKIRKV